MLEKSSIVAIVVTYHPDSGFTERFERLAGQVDAVLIVDNHSSPAAVSMLREAAARLDMRLILNPDNLGVAAALNVGIAYAIANGYEWALLFDQDTTPGGALLEGFEEAYDTFPRKDNIAIMGANYTEADSGKLRFSKPTKNRLPWRERRVVITSGSLISLKIYQMLGPFRDEYFIDCVDEEYCLRARSKGFDVIATSKPLMVHGVGRPTRHRLPWREIDVTNHDRMRRYYMFRNDIDLVKKYVLREPAWVFGSLWTRFKSMLLVCVFEDDRLAKIKYSTMGFFDGLCSKFDRKLG